MSAPGLVALCKAGDGLTVVGETVSDETEFTLLDVWMKDVGFSFILGIISSEDTYPA